MWWCSNGGWRDCGIALPLQALIIHAERVVPQGSQCFSERLGQVLVELDSHSLCTGTGGSGKSSKADGAAKAITARMAFSVSRGNSAIICSGVSPAARQANTTRRGMRAALSRSECAADNTARRFMEGAGGEVWFGTDLCQATLSHSRTALHCEGGDFSAKRPKGARS